MSPFMLNLKRGNNAAYLHLFGKEAELQLIKHISEYEHQHQLLLSHLPASVQLKYKLRQRDAAEAPGS